MELWLDTQPTDSLYYQHAHVIIYTNNINLLSWLLFLDTLKDYQKGISLIHLVKKAGSIVRPHLFVAILLTPIFRHVHWLTSVCLFTILKSQRLEALVWVG